MKFNLFGGEKFTPTEKNLTKQREVYEKQTKSDAHKENSLLENITKKGIDKEHVMIADAKTEDRLRDKLAGSIHYKEGFAEINELLIKNQNSTLTYEARMLYDKNGSPHRTSFLLDGLIAGKKVKIKGITKDDNPWSFEGLEKISGSVDGKSISDLASFELLSKYQHVAESRKEVLEDIHETAIEEEKDRKEQAEYEKEIKKEDVNRQKLVDSKKKIDDEIKSIFDNKEPLQLSSMESNSMQVMLKKLAQGSVYEAVKIKEDHIYSTEIEQSPAVQLAAKKGLITELSKKNANTTNEILRAFNIPDTVLQSDEVVNTAKNAITNSLSKGEIHNVISLINSVNYSIKNFNTDEINQINEILSNEFPSNLSFEQFINLSKHGQYGAKLCSSIKGLTRFSFNDQIMPVILAQGDGAYAYFESIKRIKNFQDLSDSDNDYIIYVGKKYGTKSRNILDNILCKTASIGNERQVIEGYVSEIGVVDFSIYQLYKQAKENNNQVEIQSLKERINVLQDTIYEGRAVEKDYADNLYGAVSFYTFPPAIGVTQFQYNRLNQIRPDRRSDVSEKLNELQYLKIEIPTGRYTLSEGVDLNIEQWSMIADVVKKVNKAEEDGVNSNSTNNDSASVLIDIYQNKKQNTPEGQSALLEEMYRYHIAIGGGKLEDSYDVSISGLMTYKEFVGDRIKNDLVRQCLEDWRIQNPKEYNELKKETMNRIKQNENRNFAKVKNMTEAINRQTDNAKKDIAIEKLNDFLNDFDLSYEQIKNMDSEQLQVKLNEIEVKYEGELTKFNYQSAEYYNSTAFINAFDQLVSRYDQDELVIQKISSDLVADINKKMRKEMDKFKFHGGQGADEKRELKIIISKKKEHGVVGFNMGVCVTPDEKLWNDPQFMNAIIFDPIQKQAMGGIHFLIRENCLCLPGINPSLDVLSQVENDALYDKIIDYALKVKEKLGLDKVLIPTSSAIRTNRTQIQNIITKKNYSKINLQNDAEFSYSPKYSFKECFEVI